MRRFTFLLPLTLCMTALCLPPAVRAEGREPLRLTSEDVGAAQGAFGELLAQSARASQRLTGLPEAAEHGRSSLGAPLPVTMIGLDALRRYQPGDPFEGLIEHLGAVLYAVQVGDEVRAELEFNRAERGWLPIRIGASSHAREVARLSKAAGPPSYLLRVPALGVEFLASGGGGDSLRLVLVHASPGVELPAGQPLSAAQVLRVLVPLARTHNGQLS